MENKKRFVVEQVYEEDTGRSRINILFVSEKEVLPLPTVQKMLMSALAVGIKGSDNQPIAMREAIEFLENAFIDTDSFEDVEVFMPKK